MDKQAFAFLKENDLCYTIWDKKYRYNNESFEKWLERVSGHNQKIKQLIKEKKFIFGGRTLRNRGTNDGSLSNCYSRGFVKDSLTDILKANSDIAITFKAQGGQGLSLSKIRPKGAKIKTGYESDGIIPFMEMFNTTTNSISQGGSRKGALLMSLDAEHKQIYDFITIKSDLNRINKANLSVEINDRFMNAVEEYYKTNKEVTYEVTQSYDSGEITYEVCPIKIYKEIIKLAHKTAEPGVLFTKRLRDYNLMEFVEDYQIETTNPCSEQPLPPHASCNLCAINLSEYVLFPFTKNAQFALATLLQDLKYIIPAMDDIISENMERHALPEQREVARKFRNIGVGFMGIADMLAKMRMVYGSIDANKFLDEIFHNIFCHGVIIDANLGKERGSFPSYDSRIWDSEIIKNHFDTDQINMLKYQNTLRNCSLFTIAPTGSIGTMLDASTGIEPIFNLIYTRRTESLVGKEKTFEVKCGVFDEWSKLNNNTKDIPSYFITAKDVPWEYRVACQSVLQRHIDSAISSTINLSKETTVEEIEQIYLTAWQKGLKGLTIYVDGSRDPILSDTSIPTQDVFPQTSAPKRPKELAAKLHVVKVDGKKYAIVVGLLQNKPYEVFATILDDPDIKDQDGTIIKVKKGCYNFVGSTNLIENIHLNADNKADLMKAHTYFMSMLLRHGAQIKYIIKTARKINDNIVSFSAAICRILAKYETESITEELCPNCQSKIVHEGGCKHCSNCEYSECMLIIKDDKN